MVGIARFVVAFAFSLLLPLAAQAATDGFIGTWRLNKANSVIATDPGIKSKEFNFKQTADGVLITETLEMLAEHGEKHSSQIAYTYGKPTAHTGGGFDTILVVKADDHTAYWTVLGDGHILSQLQVNLSADGKLMTFRYLWAASDPTGKTFNDRYIYERQSLGAPWPKVSTH